MKEKLNFEKDVKILQSELLKKFGIHAKYVLFECTCGRTWGVNVGEENTLRPDQLLCQRCSINKVVTKLL